MSDAIELNSIRTSKQSSYNDKEDELTEIENVEDGPFMISLNKLEVYQDYNGDIIDLIQWTLYVTCLALVIVLGLIAFPLAPYNAGFWSNWTYIFIIVPIGSQVCTYQSILFAEHISGLYWSKSFKFKITIGVSFIGVLVQLIPGAIFNYFPMKLAIFIVMTFQMFCLTVLLIWNTPNINTDPLVYFRVRKMVTALLFFLATPIEYLFVDYLFRTCRHDIFVQTVIAFCFPALRFINEKGLQYLVSDMDADKLSLAVLTLTFFHSLFKSIIQAAVVSVHTTLIFGLLDVIFAVGYLYRMKNPNPSQFGFSIISILYGNHMKKSRNKHLLNIQQLTELQEAYDHDRRGGKRISQSEKSKSMVHVKKPSSKLPNLRTRMLIVEVFSQEEWVECIVPLLVMVVIIAMWHRWDHDNLTILGEEHFEYKKMVQYLAILCSIEILLFIGMIMFVKFVYNISIVKMLSCQLRINRTFVLFAVSGMMCFVCCLMVRHQNTFHAA